MSGPHSNGEVIGDRYEILNYVNEGGMQYVYAANDTILGRTVALKTPKNNTAQKRFRRSAVVSAKVNHPNVAKTLDYLEFNGRPYLIEEFIDGPDLKTSFLSKINYVDPYIGAKIFHHLAKGIAAAHHVNVVHRDLKPTNVMVSNDPHFAEIKITDFGIAKMADAELTEAAEGGDESITASQTAVGALPYMAPEAIEDPKSVGLKADIWSLGAMMYELLTGQKPFGTGLIAVKRITDANPVTYPAFLTSNNQFSPLAKQLMAIIDSCLKKNPTDRPSADELTELCGQLCYPVAERFVGVVKTIKYRAWGFIQGDEADIFFHLDSVYGEKVAVNDTVVYSKFPGGGAWRAHPVLKVIPVVIPITI